MHCRLGVLTSHPIQYQAPLFRELAKRLDLQVFFAHRQTAEGQADAGFGVAFDWDLDLLDGYAHKFLPNRARRPNVSRFSGCDTPEIANEIRNGRFDAFLVMGWYLKSYWQAVHACRRHGVPVMVRGDSRLGATGGRAKEWIKTLVYPHLLRRFDACLYVGKQGREYLTHYGVPADRLYFSPHCVDNEWFASRAADVNRDDARRRFGFEPQESVALFVGKLVPGKRPLDLLRAAARLRSQGLRMRAAFAGSGTLEKAIAGEAEHLGVPLSLLGFRNQSEMPLVYRSVDVLVLPSESETWGLVVNEALACGTPAVVSDAVGCAPDLVQEGVTGGVYPVGKVPELADVLQRVIAHPLPAAGIRERSRAYSVEAAADGVLTAVAGVRKVGVSS